MSKTTWALAAALVSTGPALADTPGKPAPAPAAGKPGAKPPEKMAVSPILGATTREVMMPGKGMPKKALASPRHASHGGSR